MFPAARRGPIPPPCPTEVNIRTIRPQARPGICSALLAALVLPMVIGACTTNRLADGRPFWSAKADPRLLGDRLVVVFMPDDWPARLTEDAQATYARWAGRLEQFVARSECLTEVRKVDFRHADEVFSGRGLPVNEFTILAVRGDGYGLYTTDPLMDAFGFDYAEAFLRGMEKDVLWPNTLHMGERALPVPRQWKLVRLRPGHFARPGAPATPSAPGTPAPAAEPPPRVPVTTQPAGEGGPPVVPAAKAPAPDEHADDDKTER